MSSWLRISRFPLLPCVMPACVWPAKIRLSPDRREDVLINPLMPIVSSLVNQTSAAGGPLAAGCIGCQF